MPRGGARIGAGRKPNRMRNELAQIMDACVKPSDRMEMLKAARDAAKQGSLRHLEFIFAYAYGRPAQRVILEGDEEGGPLRLTYVNDWRDQAAPVRGESLHLEDHPVALPAPGPANGTPPGEAPQLAVGGPEVAEDDALHVGVRGSGPPGG